MKRHWKLWVRGKVQGVYYRKSAKLKADELQLFGWIRNEADGSVYIEVEGNENALTQFTDWCRQGSANAIVEQVKIETGIVIDYQLFEIKRL